MEDKLSKSDIERKQLEEVSDQSEQCFSLKLENGLSTFQNMANLELSDIIDVQSIKPLMEDFYKLTHIPIGINDLKGNVLAGVGWQDICTRFHRANPETCRHCVESNIKLSLGVVPGEFKLYRCKNNMWDIVTPIMVGDQHVGYVFAGQFFFEDEPLDYELFRSQARKYGFIEEEYIAALEKVPRLSREAVETGMGFFMTFANMLSQLSYSNIKLAKSLAERDSLVDRLQENKKDFDRAQAVGNIGSWRLDVCKNELKWSDENHHIFGIPKGTPLTYETFLSAVHPEDREYVEREWKTGLKGEPYDIEHRIVVEDKIKWVREKAYLEFDKDGTMIGAFGITQDITERKRAEEELKQREKQYQTLGDTIPYGVWLTDAAGYCTYVSSSFLELVDMSMEQVQKFGWLHLLPPEDVQPTVDYWLRCIQTGENFEKEHRFRAKDGSYQNVLAIGRPIKNDSGKITGWVGLNLDITERKQIEEALRESEKRFRAFVMASSEIVYRVNPDWSEMRYLYGRGFLANTEIPSRKWLQEYVLPEDQQHVMSVINEAIRTKSTYKLEHRVRLANGSIGWIFSRAVPIMDPNGEIVEWFGAASDITKRKEAEAKLKETLDNLENLVKKRTSELENAYNSLKESEKRLDEAQRMAHIGNWVWDIATGKEYWSDELHRIFKRDPQEAAPSYKEYLNYVHPDDRDYVDNAFKGTINGKPYEIDHRIILANGEERTVHIQAEVVFDNKNIPIQTKGIVQDITERKKAEENIQYLANIVESTTDAVVTVSLDSIVTSWNKGAEQIFGYTAEEILGKKVSILEPENLREEIKQLVENVMQGEKVKHYESSRLKKDGTIIIVSGTLFPVFDTSGKLVAISVIVRDITDIKRAEEALKNLEIIRKKEIHHRIKNNLQVISSLLDLQAEKFNNRECINDSEVLEAFRESQDRVMSIAFIHEELHEGKGEDALNFSLYLQRLLKNLFQTYRFGNTEICLNLDLEENIFFGMDTAVPLGIIVNELISNSLKYAFSGRKNGEIQIKLFSTAINKDLNIKEELTGKCSRYTLIVSDNGVGIPEKIDFKNSDSLGLQLVNLLVDQLDGTLELKRGKGTEFIMKFSDIE